jgi:hypothetical protein
MTVDYITLCKRIVKTADDRDDAWVESMVGDCNYEDLIAYGEDLGRRELAEVVLRQRGITWELPV